MGSIVRLVALEITNIKNVRNGRIVMPNASQKQLSYKKAEVLGLYGQNGSGKTAVIDALDILQRVMIGFTLKDEIAGYIGVDCRQSGIEADFNIFSEKAIYEVHYEVWLQKKPRLAAAGAANNQHIFVPGGLGVLGAAVHGKPFRLRQDDVVLKFGGDIGRDVLGVAPTGRAVLHIVPVLLGVLALDVDRQPQGRAAQQPHQQISGVKAGEVVLERGGNTIHKMQYFLRCVRSLCQPPCQPKFGGI